MSTLTMIAFAAGVFVGTLIGVYLMCLLYMARDWRKK
jgi:hypothetical protein